MTNSFEQIFYKLFGYKVVKKSPQKRENIWQNPCRSTPLIKNYYTFLKKKKKRQEQTNKTNKQKTLQKQIKKMMIDERKIINNLPLL